MGDFDFSTIEQYERLPKNAAWHEKIFDKVCWFWIVWGLIAYLLCIIFLNFLIAEACEIYARINEDLDNCLVHGKASLINESEEMLPGFYMRMNAKKIYPKYLVVREVE